MEVKSDSSEVSQNQQPQNGSLFQYEMNSAKVIWKTITEYAKELSKGDSFASKVVSIKGATGNGLLAGCQYS